ncbi:hypothetical protein [Micromonospora sp. NPDC005205]|uniref:hypothetical protein n=1 Tax=Micromonospora sp. NPDC005205 TaxID=3156714 RepID=UPI0033A026FD
MAAAPAQATTTHSPCTWGDMCYYFASNYSGAQTGVWDYNVPDLASPAVYFRGGGSGSGQRLWNNAGSGYNADEYNCVAVYFNQNYGTPALYLARYGQSGFSSTTLGVVNNDNRSQRNYSC